MKKTLLTISTLGLIAFTLSSFDSVESVHAVMNGSGAPAGSTGSPGDGISCTSCHGGPATASSGWINTTVPAGGYEPGQTYTITAKVKKSGISKFGFQLAVQNAAGNALGTLVNTNNATTQLVGQGKYATHRLQSTSGTDSATWSVDWVAPAAGTGNVTIYLAGNAANGNNQSTGDQIFTELMTISEALLSAKGAESKLDMQVFPNPGQGIFTLSSQNPHTGNVLVDVRDMKGQLIRSVSLDNNELNNGYSLDLRDLNTGLYLLQVSASNGASHVEKLVIQ
ncbi:MAG: T9SS type A sorting domain-containing protein [Bacteroidetes bacterium]|nr:MAG: T9SS type A sorting domain-containing protein [Bacteroidota bacterium]